MSEEITNKTCCCCNTADKQNDSASNSQPKEPDRIQTPKDSPKACCSIRENGDETQQTGKLHLLSYFQSVPGQLVLATISGISLGLSLFGVLRGIIPIDPAWIAILLSGTPLFWNAICSLRERHITAEVLVSTAIIATIYTNEIFAGGEVAFIMMLGHLLENWTIRRARAGIEKLIQLTPRTARKVESDREVIVDAKEVRIGEILRVLPGESVPVDGKILSGNTSIDQQLMTGEPLPVDKETGDDVFAGTINRFGAFTMQATKVGSDSSLARMIRLVREAESKKAPMERITDRWASILVPLAILTAVLVGLITQDMMRAVTILVVFCPCSLVLATPTAIIAAIGNASRYGILIRSGEIMEHLGRIQMVAFDKTGTLTLGKPILAHIQPLAKPWTEDSLLSLAASVEQSSEHPLSRCIVDAALRRNRNLVVCENAVIIPGRGIQAEVSDNVLADWQDRGSNASNGDKEDDSISNERGKMNAQNSLSIGNEKMMLEQGITISSMDAAKFRERADQGETVVWIAINSEIVGFVSLSDTIRPSAPQAVRKLRDSGMDVMLLTGDNSRAANTIAESVGISTIHSGILPEDKQHFIQAEQDSGKAVAMVGDGINDAPALKTADIGIAMGKIGSDLAIEAADVTLVGDDLSRIPFLVQLSRKTIRTIFANITLSMSINFVAIILASRGDINPVIGALVHNLGSLLVVFNASLLLRVKKEK